ncbi:Secreted protein containing internal repeats [Pseudoalteromonas luteoviolacea B = ATCC 29581]|nr:Secreted protein containing internal repeats [Pseudoalteromonas luteoviolacea B = ATCC 29581]
MKKTLFALISLFVISTNVYAEESKILTQHFDLEKKKQFILEVPVGRIDLQTNNSDKIDVRVEITPKNEGDSWFGSDVNLDKFSIEAKNTESELYLTIDSDEIEQIWQVTIPKSLALNLELGVGKVEVSDLANSATIEVGVGKVLINTALNDFKAINLDSGVGKTRVKGFEKNIEHNKNVVSSDVKYRGDGQYSIDVEVGVGDAKVEKR